MDVARDQLREAAGTRAIGCVVVRGEDAEGRPSYELTVELPEDFALDQPLSPFLLAALFTDVLLERLRQLSRTGRQLQRAAGILLAVVGVLMITGRLEAISYWLLETFPALGRIG